MNIETLVGWNYPQRGQAEATPIDAAALCRRIRDAGDEHAVFVVDIADVRPGTPRERIRVAFDADKVRNTHVHGYGYAAGLVVHIDHDDDEMADHYNAHVADRWSATLNAQGRWEYSDNYHGGVYTSKADAMAAGASEAALLDAQNVDKAERIAAMG